MLGFARAGSLYAYMKSSIPQSEWGERAGTLLGVASAHPSQNMTAIRAVLASGKLPPEECAVLYDTFFKLSAPAVLELFLAAGMLPSFRFFISALESWPNHARVLIANGSRITAFVASKAKHITAEVELFEFQQKICLTRRGVVALLRLRRVGVDVDKFLARQIALEMWAARWE